MIDIETRLVLVVLFVCSCTYGQKEMVIKKSEDISLIRALNSSELLSENREPWLVVRIYRQDNGIASAGFPSSEVSFNLLVAVSEHDDAPRQALFEAGPFLNPIFHKWDESQEYTKGFSVLVGTAEERTQISFQVRLEGLFLKE